MIQLSRPVFYVYILTCNDGTYYTGITTDLSRRLSEHNGTSLGAKYTRSRRPVKIAASWIAGDRSSALREEARIKKLSRKQKQQMIDKFVIERDFEKSV